MKKVVFIMPHVTGKGGTENVVRTVMRMLQNDSRYDPLLYILGGSEDKVWLSGINYKETVFSNNRWIRNIQNLGSLFWCTMKFLKEEKPDIVITTHSINCFIINMVRKLTNKNYPIVSWIHFSLKAKNVKEKLLPYADYHLAICPSIKREFNELNIADNNVYTINNPINYSNKNIGRPEEKKKFLYVGRVIFEGQKRLKDLFTALSKVKGDWQLDIVGDGKDVGILKEYAKQLKIDENIVWHGWQANPWTSVNMATALVLTSAFEGFGMVLAEAISHGIYCISSNCEVGPSDIIKSNVNGELYETGNTLELQQVLQAVINGKILPSQEQIKESISHLYIDEFSKGFKYALEDIIKKWRLKMDK